MKAMCCTCIKLLFGALANTLTNPSISVGFEWGTANIYAD